MVPLELLNLNFFDFEKLNVPLAFIILIICLFFCMSAVVCGG